MTIYLGSSPCDEECASVGDEHYTSDARIEIAAYIDQLNRTFVLLNDELNISFCKKREAHDFGSYYEVAVEYESGSFYGQAVAYTIEDFMPEEWDSIALQDIIQKTASAHFDALDLSPAGTLAWMTTPVASVDQGRRILALIRKVRDGRRVTTNEVYASVQPDPADLLAPGCVRKHIVILAVPDGRWTTINFECQATGAELAIEQAKLAHPSYELLMHFVPG